MILKQTIIDALTAVHPHKIDRFELSRQQGLTLEETDRALLSLKTQKFPVIIEEDQVGLAYPLLSLPIISRNLETNVIGASLELYTALESTSAYAKENLSRLRNGKLILAHAQTAGKGRMGRSWDSPAGSSIAMSLVLKPDIKLEAIPLLTQLTAAALVKALEPWAEAEIKWPNDILLAKKKIAGILIETEFSGSSLQGIVVGIGINTNITQKDLPKDLQKKATSIKEAVNREIDPNLLVTDFLHQFESYYEDFIQSQRTAPFLSVCRSQSALIGKDYWIIDKKHQRKASIETIDPSGGLVVRYLDNNETETLTSSAVSIRGDDSYV